MSVDRQLKRIESALFRLDELRSRALFRVNPVRAIRRASARLGLGVVVPDNPEERKLSRIASALEAVG